MAPSRKRKSDEMAEPTTPEASNTPASKRMRITQTQKQALIDNLQLEITERARHLRAHYALQCADLKSRIERRINRIPVSMRSMTMGELIVKHNPPPALPAKPIIVAKAQAVAPPASRPARKRKSSIVIAADPIQESSNENEDETTTFAKPAPLPKARTTKRPASRTGKTTGGVLSPRSHNSRTLPRSPIKPATTTMGIISTSAVTAECQPPSPTKSFHMGTGITRPTSPLKPISPLKSAALATTSAISTSMHNMLASAKSTAARGKAAASSTVRTVSQASNHSAASATSTGTVVKGNTSGTTKSVRGRGAAGAAAKKIAQASKDTATATVTKSKAGTVRKGAATTTTTKKVVPAEPATTGRRILRKRN